LLTSADERGIKLETQLTTRAGGVQAHFLLVNLAVLSAIVSVVNENKTENGKVNFIEETPKFNEEVHMAEVFDEMDEVICLEIDDMIRNILDEKPKNKTNDNFSKYIKDNRYRTYFMSCLNQVNNKGRKFLSEKGFKLLANLLRITCGEIHNCKDFANLETLLRISKEFYMEVNLSKYLASRSIEDMIDVKDYNIWVELIKHTMNDQNHQKTHKDFTYASVEKVVKLFLWFFQNREDAIKIIEDISDKYKLEFEDNLRLTLCVNDHYMNLKLESEKTNV